MFIAKFQEVVSNKFNPDKNGNHSFIGEVLAGTSNGTIINGTMFKREGLQPNVAYACINETEDYEGTTQIITKVISKVDLMELDPLMKQLGKANLVLQSSNSTVE